MLLILSSAYISGRRAPKQKNRMDRDAVNVEMCNQRILQRLVDTDRFYGSSKERCDNVMVRKRRAKENVVERISCWFVKVLLLLKISITSSFTSPSSKWYRADIDLDERNAESEIYFVPWYK